MARKRSKYKRRRTRGRFAFLYKALTFLVICGAIAVALAFFFKVETIVVTGNSRYSEQQIVEASGLHIGDNMFLLNKYDTSDRITSALPYVATVRISRQLPGTLVVELNECTAPAAILHDGKAWLLSGEGKVVDSVTVSQSAQYTVITGLDIIEPEVGKIITVAPEDEDLRTELIDLLHRLSEKNMLADTDSISLEDPSLITMQFMERFEVRIPHGADFNYKLDYLTAVIQRLEANETGTIDMTQDEKVSFIPTRRRQVKPTAPEDAPEGENTDAPTEGEGAEQAPNEDTAPAA